MNIFLLIIRILLLLGFLAGIIMVAIANIVTEAKKFKKQEHKNHYKARFKVIGFLVSACALVLLMILSLIN